MHDAGRERERERWNDKFVHDIRRAELIASLVHDRDTSTHTKLSSLPSLVLNLHDFGQLSNRGKPTCSCLISPPLVRKILSSQEIIDANHFFPTYVVYVGELFLGGTSLDFSNPGPGFCPACGVVGDNPPDHCGISCLSRPTTAPTAYFFRRLRLPMTQQSVFPR